MWDPRRLTSLWDFKACYRDSFTLFLLTLALPTAWAASVWISWCNERGPLVHIHTPEWHLKINEDGLSFIRCLLSSLKMSTNDLSLWHNWRILKGGYLRIVTCCINLSISAGKAVPARRFVATLISLHKIERTRQPRRVPSHPSIVPRHTRHTSYHRNFPACQQAIHLS
jgi:hypothetical protein